MLKLGQVLNSFVKPTNSNASLLGVFLLCVTVLITTSVCCSVFIVRCQETRVRVFGRLPRWLRKLGGFPDEVHLNSSSNTDDSPSQPYFELSQTQTFADGLGTEVNPTYSSTR